jgi:hypothetical protein
MLRSHLSSILAAAITACAATLTAVGQTGELRGQSMKQADGQTVPLGDVAIDVIN